MENTGCWQEHVTLQKHFVNPDGKIVLIKWYESLSVLIISPNFAKKKDEVKRWDKKHSNVTISHHKVLRKYNEAVVMCFSWTD